MVLRQLRAWRQSFDQAKQIEAQMVYKRQANTSRVSADFPNLSLAQVYPCRLATP